MTRRRVDSPAAAGGTDSRVARTDRLVRVAVPVPLYETFDYRWSGPGPLPAVGSRVRVPFGRGERIGLVLDHPQQTSVSQQALKDVTEALDAASLIDAELMATLKWCAAYYHHPPGEVLLTALPAALRRGGSPEPATAAVIVLTPAGAAAEVEDLRRRAPRQAEAIARLRETPGAIARAELGRAGIGADTLRRLEARGLIATQQRPIAAGAARPAADPARPELTADQQTAVAAIRAARGEFAAFLLFGVTGSGKTEVFLRLIEDVLGAGGQTVLLVPEISLTPQMVGRLEDRFGGTLAVLHSGLTDADRLASWRAARDGTAQVIVGTRSAVFCPLPRAGLIIVDEEHDPSFKQQTGFRYSARDLAVIRARALNVPVVLASATPSLETIRNAREGRYRELTLPRRIGASRTPKMHVVDMRRHAARNGLSTPLIAHLTRHLDGGNQVLLYINRRGFAPVLYCSECAVVADCPRCDAHLTVHARSGVLRCHHCGREQKLAWGCPACGTERVAVGEGTQRITDELAALFPGEAVARLDRDVLTSRDRLGAILQGVESGATRIIVGTQLLAKGHDFPGVTLVGVLNADQGLFGTDFRSEERLAQTLVQVAGRAGRRELPGDVVIQTHFPEHPLLTRLLDHDYAGFAAATLAERAAAGWPPYSHLVLWRAEATRRDTVYEFLRRLKAHAAPLADGVRLFGPAASVPERVGGRYRAQLLMQGGQRAGLHTLADACIGALQQWPQTRRVRWAIDVDPIET